METNYLMSIDQGTSSTRALIFNQNGKLISRACCQINQYYPKVGWVEHDVEEIWRKTIQVCRDAINKAHLTAAQIKACGITNQRETTVTWNKLTGKVYHRAIVWQDRRTQTFCKQLCKQGLSKVIQAKTGLIIDPYFSATKLHWLLEHISCLRSLANKGILAFGTIDSFLLWRLTKGKNHATDATNASRTMLYNIKEQQWDEELLRIFKIPPQILPNVLDSSGLFGIIDKEYFGAAIPITSMIGDQQAAVVGQGCLQTGMLKSTYGTGGFLLLNTGKKIINSQHRLLTTTLYRLKGQVCYCLEGGFFNAGSIIKWLRDNMKLIKDANETQILANQVTNNGGVYLVPAFTGLGAPYWAPESRGALLGLTINTKSSHIIRAALESIAYQTMAIMTCMEKDIKHPIASVRVGGGVANNTWLLQFLADLLAKPVFRGSVIEASALGAAYLAALAVGFYSTVEEIGVKWQAAQDFIPQQSSASIYKRYQNWQLAVQQIINSNIS